MYGSVSRGTSNRITGRKLQHLRRRLFQEQPLCVQCQQQGRVALAVERDHIVALCNGGTDTADNTQALCAACHEAKTLADTGTETRRPAIGVDGWPIGRGM